MDIRQTIVDRIDGFLARTGMSERQFGIEVAGDHKLIKRLRGGAGITLTVLERAMRFMADPEAFRAEKVARDPQRGAA